MELNEKLNLLNLGEGTRCENYDKCFGVGNTKTNPKSKEKSKFATHKTSTNCPWLRQLKELSANQNMKRLSYNLAEKECLQKENGKLFTFFILLLA